MANLPSFSPFSVDLHADEQSAGPRWRKWIDRFENPLCALDINDDRQKKAMLLHYVGEEVYDIFDSFTDQQKGLGAVRETPDGNVPDEYGVAKRSLTEFFTPKKNTIYEIFKFRQASQNSGERIDSFYTRLRTLASTCDFHDADKEILSQILQGCTSSRLRRKVLKDVYTLKQVLDEAKALELSESRASVMEGKCVDLNAVSSHRSSSDSFKRTDSSNDSCASGSGAHGHRNFAHRGRKVDRGRSTHRGRGRDNTTVRGSSRYPGSHRGGVTRRSDTNSCHYCGGPSSHASCPAKGKECRRCH